MATVQKSITESIEVNASLTSPHLSSESTVSRDELNSFLGTENHSKTLSEDASKDSIAEQKNEEEKLRIKYPLIKKQGLGSTLLQKRLNKGTKFFDSGDYNVAKAEILKKKKVQLETVTSTGEPGSDDPGTGKIDSLPDNSVSVSQTAADVELLLHDVTGETIATVETVPAVRRKSCQAGAGIPSTLDSLVTPHPGIFRHTSCSSGNGCKDSTCGVEGDSS